MGVAILNWSQIEPKIAWLICSTLANSWAIYSHGYWSLTNDTSSMLEVLGASSSEAWYSLSPPRFLEIIGEGLPWWWELPFPVLEVDVGVPLSLVLRPNRMGLCLLLLLLVPDWNLNSSLENAMSLLPGLNLTYLGSVFLAKTKRNLWVGNT